MKILSAVLVIVCGVYATTTAKAQSLFDGSWNLTYVTEKGACDPTYNFAVNINEGNITQPNLVRFKGRVSSNGAVRASVTVQDKSASGSGKLSGTIGHGSWKGHDASGACSGYWSAQKE